MGWLTDSPIASQVSSSCVLGCVVKAKYFFFPAQILVKVNFLRNKRLFQNCVVL